MEASRFESRGVARHPRATRRSALDADSLTPCPLSGPRPREALRNQGPIKPAIEPAIEGSITMPFKLNYITPLLTAVAAMVIATAPTAAATADPPACAVLGVSAVQCQTPGNVQINDAPPAVHYKPQWNDRYGGDPIPPA